MDKNFEQTLNHVNTYSSPSELRITDMRVVDMWMRRCIVPF